jgi:hypothetical protein
LSQKIAFDEFLLLLHININYPTTFWIVTIHNNKLVKKHPICCHKMLCVTWYTVWFINLETTMKLLNGNFIIRFMKHYSSICIFNLTVVYICFLTYDFKLWKYLMTNLILETFEKNEQILSFISIAAALIASFG